MSAADGSLTRRQAKRAKSRQLVRKHYHDRGWVSPYKRYQGLLAGLLDGSSVVLDVGCGRTFPMADYLRATGAQVHGVDPVAEARDVVSGVEIKRASADALPYDNGVFDVVTSQAVLEHIEDPNAVFTEFQRVLKPGGHVVFLTPGKYDYVSIIAQAVPNTLHGKIVKATEGRAEADTFPTFYGANSKRQIRRIASRVGFGIQTLEYVNEYPYALRFSPMLCRLGILYDKLICRVTCLNWLQGWLLGVLQSAGGGGRDD